MWHRKHGADITAAIEDEIIKMPYDAIGIIKDGQVMFEWDISHLKLRKGDTISLRLTKPLQIHIEVI